MLWTSLQKCWSFASPPSMMALLMTSSSLPLLLSFRLLCRPSSISPPGDPTESLRASCDDQRVLERSWQPIICLLVASCLASHFSRVPFLLFLPWELFHIRNGLGGFSFPWHAADGDADRSVLCLFRGNLQSFVFSYVCMINCARKPTNPLQKSA